MTSSVIVRVDVDTPTDSLLLNKLRLKRNYLKYIEETLKIVREYGARITFMFRVPYTLPESSLVEELNDYNCEVALHSDGFTLENIIQEKELLKESAGEVYGISYHGCDLDDYIIFKLTRNRRIIMASGTPFYSLLAGFQYDANGYYVNHISYLNLEGKSLMMFPSYVTLDKLSHNSVEEIFQRSLPIFMFHPNYLNNYGFRKPTLPILKKVFDYMSRHDYITKTYKEVCLDSGRENH